MVLLDKDRIQTSRFLPAAQIKALKEKAARIAKNLRLQDKYLGDCCTLYLHGITP